MLHAGGNDEILGLLVLQNQPHALDVILRVAPVAQRGEVTEVELVLLALGYTGRREGDLARHEGLAAALRLVVEQNTRAAEHVVGLAVLLDNPVAVELRHGIGAIGVERGLLVLRNLLDLAVELRGRSLVNAAGLGQTAQTHGLENTQHTRGIDIGGELRRVERHLHMALGRKVIDLVRAYLADHLDDAHRVAEVGVVEVEMGLAFEVCNPLAVVGRRAADCAVDVVSFRQQKFSQKRAVLARDSGDKRSFHIFLIVCLLFLLLVLASALLPEQPRQGAEDSGAARELLAGLLEDSVDELQMAANHPLGRPRDVGPAEELEGGSDGNHDAAMQIGLQPAHEELLLGGSECHPDDVGTVGLHHAGNLWVVELLNLAERQLNKLHLRHIGIFMNQVLLEPVENGL